MKRAVAALLIAISALVAGGVTTQAGAEPRGWRGRRSRGRGYYRPRYEAPNPLPGILGGILGGWLAEQMKPAEPPAPPPFYDEEEDDSGRDSREGRRGS